VIGTISDSTFASRSTRLQIYFCDLNSSWQRGSNENTNGPLRQRSSDLSLSTQHPRTTVAYSRVLTIYRFPETVIHGFLTAVTN